MPTTRSWPTTKRREAVKVLLTTSWPTTREAKVPLTTTSVADNQNAGRRKGADNDEELADDLLFKMKCVL